MKKIYMILAAMTLLSMSLNAQRLPGKSGIPNFMPTGTAYKYTPNGQFRMPTLNSGEYLFGPYTTDDFDATGIGYANYYNAAQDITTVVMLNRSEFEEHLGDEIIGFRFALAGSQTVNVSNFVLYPTDESSVYSSQGYTWNLGQMMSGNTSTSTETFTGYSDITIAPSGTAVNFTRIAVVSGNTTITEWVYPTSSLNSDWSCTGTFNVSTYYGSGYTSGTITIPSSLFSSYTNVQLVITAYGDNGNTSITVNSGAARSITTSSASYTWDIEPTAQSTTVYAVEIGRGATKNENLPVSGWNMDYGFQNQMIYRAGQLAMANGAQITGVTFYPEEGIGIPFSGSQITVKLGNTTSDNFGTGVAAAKMTGLTTVATITPVADHDATAWRIDFATPFTYTGGNIVLEMLCNGNGDFAHANFLGDNQSANVSLISTGQSATQTSNGSTSTFLPKATFTFTGNVNTPTYLTLQGGEWHDFFLEEPVVFSVPDGDDHIFIGYTFHQLYDENFKPMAVNSNSTGHTHYSLMYAASSSSSSYSRTWWNDGVSGPDNNDRPGDLAVQLIFKSQMEQTPAPTITYTYDNGTYYITATATDPDATVTLSVGGQTGTGTGSVTIPVGRGNQDYTVTATATAQEPEKLVSDPTTETITIEASLLEPTPAPSISSQVLDLTVEVTGSGQGEVHMYVDGREVSNPGYLERGTEDYYVTVAVTAQINDTQHSMSTTTEQVLVPKLDNLDELINGWIELPGTYTNDKVINWNDNLMFIDRFTASTADNDHPAKYIYKMTEDDIKLIGEPRSTNEHIIPVMKTGSQVSGLYDYKTLDADVDRSMPIQVTNANVQMNLEQSNDIYYYTLDRAINKRTTDFTELSKLQNRRDDWYTEMDHNYKYGENIHFGPIVRHDTIGSLDDKKVWGTDFRAYVPIVWTMGNDVSNTRANWENDHLHNSYGSPIWMNSVGKVELTSCSLERQQGMYGSTNYKDDQGNECSLYFLQLDAKGFLPAKNICNVDYRPYMFRVFVESPTDKLRGFSQVLTPGTDSEHTGEDGSHLVYNPNSDHHMLCIYEEKLDPEQILEYYLLSKPKSNTWAENLMFGGLNSINEDPNNLNDLFVYVRFYYIDANGLPEEMTLRLAGPAPGDGPGGGGAEGPGAPGSPSTGIVEMVTPVHGEVVEQMFYNVQGMKSETPFDGINIVVTRYSDGSTTTTKVVR